MLAPENEPLVPDFERLPMYELTQVPLDENQLDSIKHLERSINMGFEVIFYYNGEFYEVKLSRAAQFLARYGIIKFGFNEKSKISGYLNINSDDIDNRKVFFLNFWEWQNRDWMMDFLSTAESVENPRGGHNTLCDFEKEFLNQLEEKLQNQEAVVVDFNNARYLVSINHKMPSFTKYAMFRIYNNGIKFPIEFTIYDSDDPFLSGERRMSLFFSNETEYKIRNWVRSFLSNAEFYSPNNSDKEIVVDVDVSDF